MSTRGSRQAPGSEESRRFDEMLAALPMRQGRTIGLLRRTIRAWCWLVRWRVDVEVGALPQRDGLAGAGVIVAAAPHRAWVEPFLLLLAWPKDAARLVWLADGRTVTRSWWRRRLLPRLGVLPVARGSGGPRHYVAIADAALARGLALAVFPEVGPPSPRDRLRRISPGFAYMALGTGAPVVPVVIGGTHRIVRGSVFSVDLLDAIDGPERAEDPFTREGRERAHALVGLVGSTIAAELPERTTRTDALAPATERWHWLGRLLR